MALEVSSAGIRRGAGSIYPAPAFLGACVERGVPCTLGSDAHTPADVGRDYAAVIGALRELGVTEIATFRRRRKLMRPLAGFTPADIQ
jgi:histidinol-phosphatase (PHP family)